MSYLIFVTSTTSSAGVKIFRLVSKKCKLVCFCVKIMNFVFFCVKKSGISVFLVSFKNGPGVNKMTNMTYDCMMTDRQTGKSKFKDGNQKHKRPFRTVLSNTSNK